MKEMTQLTMNPLEVDNAQTVDVVADRVGFKGAESTLVTLKQFLEQKPIDLTPLIQCIQTLQKEIGLWRAQESYQATSYCISHYA